MFVAATGTLPHADFKLAVQSNCRYLFVVWTVSYHTMFAMGCQWFVMNVGCQSCYFCSCYAGTWHLAHDVPFILAFLPPLNPGSYYLTLFDLDRSY